MEHRVEKFSVELWTEGQELTKSHHEEIGMYGDVDPDIYWYLRNDVWVMTAREEGELVGYAVYILGSHPHYKDIKIATQDLLYLHPDHRKGLAGVRFIKFQEKCLKVMGIDRIFQSTKRSRDLSNLYERLGYRETDIMFSKEL